MSLKMFHALMIFLIYGVDTQSVKCPESCSCLEMFVSKPNFLSKQVVFDGKNFTESGLDENFNNFKLAILNSVEMNQIKLSSEKNKSKSGNFPSATSTPFVPSSGALTPQPSFQNDNLTRKKCSKSLSESVKNIFVNNFLTKTVNNSKEMRMKRTLKLNVGSMGNGNVSQDEGSDARSRLIPRFSDSATETDDEGMTEGDLDEAENKWKTSEPGNKNARGGDGVFTYEITCDGVRDLKSLRLQYLPNETSRLIIRNTYFESFRHFYQVLREGPVNFDRLVVLSVTDNVINQKPNGGNSQSDWKMADFGAENQRAGKSRNENGVEFLPFASLQNPKLRSPKSLETMEYQFGGKFKSVRILNLINNTIRFLPQNALVAFQKVEILNLSNNFISSIANETFTPLIDLLQLDLSKNHLSTLNEIIFRNLTKLLYLDLSDNSIGNVAPSTFQYLTSLVFLNLANNHLTEKEESVAFLLGTGKRLQIVDVSRTGLKQIPGTLERSVRALNLMGNYLLSIRCGDLDSYSLLSYLNLRNNKISYVEDDALGRLELLANLQIGENNLFQIPKSLPNNLEILNLSYNNIQNITNFDFLNLSLLKELSVSYNQIGSIESNAFDNLNQLRVLDLSHNPILVLPNIYGLYKLTKLNLSYFTNIPGSNSVRYKQFPIQSPGKIKKLNLESSPLLTSVFLQDTKTLESFTNLEELDVRFSNLTTMRKDIFSLLPNMKVLKIEGNPWHCGREILMLSEWLKSHKRENLMEEENEMNTAHCSTPAYLYKTSLIALEKGHFDGEGTEADKKDDGWNETESNAGENIGAFPDRKKVDATRNSERKNNSQEGSKTVKIPPSPPSGLPEKEINFMKFSGEPAKPTDSRENFTGKVEKVTTKKHSKSGEKVKTLLRLKTVEYFGTKGNLSEKAGYEKAEVRKGSKKDSTVTRSPLIQRETEGTSNAIPKENSNSLNERVVIDWNDKSAGSEIPGKNLLDSKPSTLDLRREVKGKAEAVTAKDSLSLEKDYNTHLSFFILSSIGLVVMATLTFTSVYFSRTRRDQSYRRQSQDIEVCSISSIGNELW